MFRIMVFIMAALVALATSRLALRALRFWGAAANTRRQKLLLFAALFAAAALSFQLWPIGLMGLLHLALADLALWLVSLPVRLICSLARRQPPILLKKARASGLPQLALTLAVIIYGAFCFQHPVQTTYQVESGKLSGDYRVVLITDTHYCGLQRPQALKKAAADIQALSPDLIVLAGDMAEESSSKAQMEELFQVLGGIRTTYGIYYVYGNHDRQLYTDHPSYTPEELADAITASGITILQDSCVTINGELVLAGREDAGFSRFSGRVPIQTILQGTAEGAFIMVADHQPVNAEENAAQGVDLQLSGHTHAGQIWPLGLMLPYLGQPLNYGSYQFGGCQVIVSSGFAGWGFPLRTQERCEYVVIELLGQA